MKRKLRKDKIGTENDDKKVEIEKKKKEICRKKKKELNKLYFIYILLVLFWNFYFLV